MNKRLIVCAVLFIAVAAGFRYACSTRNSLYKLNGDLIGQISKNVQGYTKIEDMPENLINAVVCVEDRRFFKHLGLDFIAVARASYANIKEGKIKQGASTITQQLAKNLFLTNEKTFSRKLKEVVLAAELESMYTKNEILEMYLNVIYLGAGTQGVQQASQKYFHKDVKELSLEECAMLAGLPKAPSVYNPISNPGMAEKRQKLVLSLMDKNGYIGQKVQGAFYLTQYVKYSKLNNKYLQGVK